MPNGYGVVSASLAAGAAVRYGVGKAIDAMPETAVNSVRLALSLATGVAVGYATGEPTSGAILGTAAMAGMWFLADQVSGYVKPVVSNGLGAATTLGGLYLGFFAGGAGQIVNDDSQVVFNTGAETPLPHGMDGGGFHTGL